MLSSKAYVHTMHIIGHYIIPSKKEKNGNLK